MVIVEGATKHLYVCTNKACLARAVITPKGTKDAEGNSEVFRYNLPPVGEWPSTTGGETPRPKGAASFALRSGKGETTVSGPGGLMRAVAEAINGGPTTAVDIVNEILPPGIEATQDDEGNLKVSGFDEGQTQQGDRGRAGEATHPHRAGDGQDAPGDYTT